MANGLENRSAFCRIRWAVFAPPCAVTVSADSADSFTVLIIVHVVYRDVCAVRFVQVFMCMSTPVLSQLLVSLLTLLTFSKAQ